MKNSKKKEEPLHLSWVLFVFLVGIGYVNMYIRVCVCVCVCGLVNLLV
jgi:hypothetical protein